MYNVTLLPPLEPESADSMSTCCHFLLLPETGLDFRTLLAALRDFNPLLNEFLSIFVIVSWMRCGEEQRCLIVSCLKNLASLLLLTLLNMALVLWPSASPEVVTMKLVTPVNKCGFFSSTLTYFLLCFNNAHINRLCWPHSLATCTGFTLDLK